MRDAVEQISQYIGEAPITTVVEIKDCAIRIGVSGIGLEETSTNRTT